MKLVIDLPDHKPTPGDHEAILTAVDSLRIGMGLRRSPAWSIEPSELLSTQAAAALVGVSDDHWPTLAHRHFVEPARVDQRGRVRVPLWDRDDVIEVKRQREQNPPKRGPKPKESDE